MKKINYADIPNDYPVCLHQDCPMADTCLRQIAYNILVNNDRTIRIVNPTQCSKNSDCIFYRNSTPVIYALGFSNFKKHMLPDQYNSFMDVCYQRWNRNPLYERRRGVKALTPEDQNFVLNAVRTAGVTEDLKFDNYEEKLNWCD